MKNYAIIGDVHSNYSKISQALFYCKENNLTPILLGDLFDSRSSVSDSVKVYEIVKEFYDNFDAIVLQSNHQDKLIRYLKGNKVVLNHGLNKTVEEFENSSVNLKELTEWLENLPYGVVFKDKTGYEYRCAHAYFSSRIEVPNYDEFFLVEKDSLSNKIKNLMIYGPINSDGRVLWWKSPKKHSYKMVSGHYHVVVDKEHCLVLDGECGDDGDHTFLGLYDVNKKIIKKFF